MKKIIIILLIIAFSSCSTIKIPEPKPPRFTVRLSSEQIPIGEIEMQIDRTFPRSGLRTITVNVIYFPEEDAVCLHYRSDFFTYHLFWDAVGRNLYIDSLQRYNEDFEARNLISTSRRNLTTRSAYGVTEGFLFWQESRISTRYGANMNIELGYFFRERSPFFTVTQKQAVHVDMSTSKNNKASQEIPLYFTRTQSAELAALFDPDYLHSVTPSRNINNRLNPVTSFDGY